MLQKAFLNAFANHGCILQHFEGFFKTPFRSTGHQSYSLDRSRIPRGQKLIIVDKKTLRKFYNSEYMRMEVVVEVTGG